MPASPNIMYVGPRSVSRGKFDSATLADQGVSIRETWSEAVRASEERPIDTLIIDALALDSLSESEQTWLKQQFHEGVVIVSLGAQSGQVAESLGLASLRNPNETGPDIGANEYIMVRALLIADPDTQEVFEEANWIESLIKSGELQTPDVSEPFYFAFGKSRGRLTSGAEIKNMFTDIDSFIRSVYQARAEYADRVQER
jgi:hypothetical protein